MSSTESKSKAIETLRMCVRFRNMEDKEFLTDIDLDAFLPLMAEHSDKSLSAAVANVFGVTNVLAVGALVNIYPLPFSRKYGTDQPLLRKLSTLYGYVAVVSGKIPGAQVFFIDRSAIRLSEAVEVFSKLKVLS
ncbi:hypothetical protein EJJ20_20165 [Pseudomonas poae]|nr:hypothetical protein EJJ20_20165 [Pseudomonas poae]